MEQAKEWKHQLLNDYYKEINDSHHYLALAKEAEADMCYMTANALEMIAHEEMTHARYLRDKLDDWHIPHAEKEAEWEALERHFGYR
jgi:rubrerythrin